MNNSRKLAFFLPNTFTALNLSCGFVSILWSQVGRFEHAALILILGAIFDSVDGRVARMTGTQSAFGEQFDSMSDIVSFGVAPAMLMYNGFLMGLGRVGIAASIIFALCAALRLARFNANINHVSSDFFQGLPSPAAALALIGLTLAGVHYDFMSTNVNTVKNLMAGKDLGWLPYVIAAYTVIFGLLMISNIPFNSFKKNKWIKKNKKKSLAIIFLLFILIFSRVEIMLLVIMLAYTIGCIAYFFMNKGALEHIFEWNEGEESDEEDNN